MLLISVIFISCSSYNYTPQPSQYYTPVSFIEEPSQFPNITFSNWNVYSGYLNNYHYTPYYMSPYTTWSFNSFSNFNWNNNWWNHNYYGWNNNWWNHNYYGWNNNWWNHNYYGWNSNFGNTFVTNNYFFGKSSNYGSNSFGGFGQKNLSKNEEYKSIAPKKNINRSTNSPIREDKPVDRDIRINDTRNYQKPKSTSVNDYSSPAPSKSNDLRNTQPTSTKSNINSSIPNRTNEPKVNRYTPPERVNIEYNQPQKQNNRTKPNYSTPPRSSSQKPQRSNQRMSNGIKSNR